MKKFNVTYDVQNHNRKTLSIIKSDDMFIIRMRQGKDFAAMMHKVMKKTHNIGLFSLLPLLMYMSLIYNATKTKQMN